MRAIRSCIIDSRLARVYMSKVLRIVRMILIQYGDTALQTSIVRYLLQVWMRKPLSTRCLRIKSYFNTPSRGERLCGEAIDLIP